MRARMLVDLGQFANAAALVPVSAVPTNYQYLLTFDQIDRRQPDLEPEHQRRAATPSATASTRPA